MRITNVRVFDGHTLLPPGTVGIEDGLIVEHADGETLDGGVLVPGFIDAHVHLHGRPTLDTLAAYGVTTALDMACGPAELLASLRGVPGVTDVRSAGIPAIAPGSPHSRMPVVGQLGLVERADQADEWVKRRVDEGSDYIKIVITCPAPSHDQATLDALVRAAHAHGKLVVAHASSYESVQMAQRAQVDVLTHVPLDKAVDSIDPTVLIPTLAMMEAVKEQSATPDARYEAARDSVTFCHRAGVPILAGTDANMAPGSPAKVPHGESLHHELELLVDAGLNPVEALRAATVLPARHFGLHDRGTVAPGLRADLVLLDDDPLHDIRATRSIRRIWCGGATHPTA